MQHARSSKAARQRRKTPKAGQLTAQSEGSMHLSTHTGHTHTGHTHTPIRRCHMTQRVFCAVQPTAAQNQHAPRPCATPPPSPKSQREMRRQKAPFNERLERHTPRWWWLLCSAADCVVLVRSVSVSVSVSVSAKNTHSRDKRAWHASHEGSLAILALFIS